MKVTLLGFTLPPEDMEAILRTDANMPSQTHAFAWALVAALRGADISVTLLSSAPVTNFPQNSQVRFRGGPFTSEGVRGETLGFVNILLLKHLSRFAACMTRGTRALHRWRPDILMIHGVHSPYLWYGVLSPRLTGARSVVVLTDPPGVVLTTDGIVVRSLKMIDIRLVKWALRSVDGVIVLTAPLATDFAPGVASLVMEGILTAGARMAAKPSTPRPRSMFRAMYAGGLLDSYGVGRLVRAIQRLPIDEVRLAAYGKGPLDSWIDDQANLDVRIEKVQFAKREVVLEKYATADLLVQPRPADQDFVRYSFPSKLLEYMASGTPVLTTRLSGIPPKYEPHLYWIDDDSVEGIERSLRAVMLVPADERAAKGRAAAKFVAETCSSGVQGARIRDFLAEILSN
jgi:glycosyltransferase involved in cell wall biosynthesis